MKWTDVQVAYSERISKLTPGSHQQAVVGFAELEQDLQIRMPAALENPTLLSSTEWSELYRTLFFDKGKYRKKSRNRFLALRRVRSMINRMHDIGELNPNVVAKKNYFDKPVMMYCVQHWLTDNNWKNIKTASLVNSPIDVTAEKAGQHFIGYVIPAVKKTADNTGTAASLVNLKIHLGNAIVKLLECLDQSGNKIPALLFAGDVTTHQFAMRYVHHLIKTGIKIYFVHSPTDVKEYGHR